jgi:hypothetical protein
MLRAGRKTFVKTVRRAPVRELENYAFFLLSE